MASGCGVCVYVCICVYLYAGACCCYIHVCVRAYMWKPQADIQNHPWLLLHLVQWGRVSQSNPKLVHMAGLTSRLYYVFPVSSLGAWMIGNSPGIYMGSGNHTSLLAYEGSALPTEPYPQSKCSLRPYMVFPVTFQVVTIKTSNLKCAMNYKKCVPEKGHQSKNLCNNRDRVSFIKKMKLSWGKNRAWGAVCL